jgi:REP element-mobilizing transposase RayT
LSLHTNHDENFEVYFCTVTCYQWLPLFEEANAYDVVYKWFENLYHNGCLVVGYVIMPNHVHVLLYPTHHGTSLSLLVGEGKRFMAYAIVKGLKRSGKELILQQLQNGVEIKERQRGKKHQVFRLSFDARKCYSEKMIEQKLDYIHHNPVRGKWSLCDDFAHYPYSSAGFYELGMSSKIKIAHYKELVTE